MDNMGVYPKKSKNEDQSWIYWFDGLAVSCATPRQKELKKKEICKVFKDI